MKKVQRKHLALVSQTEGENNAYSQDFENVIHDKQGFKGLCCLPSNY